jgi:hypothetical protein
MPTYPRLNHMLARMTSANTRAVFDKQVVPYLVDTWLRDYQRLVRKPDIVETSVSAFSYLFDSATERLIAAWGFSKGRHGAARDKSRMAGHPLSAGPLYHRGHAIPHTLGGPTDINLVPQRGAINIGPFRALEKKAVATPGALYFTYWIYRKGLSQKPVRVEQGLLVPGQKPEIRIHPN